MHYRPSHDEDNEDCHKKFSVRFQGKQANRENYPNVRVEHNLSQIKKATKESGQIWPGQVSRFLFRELVQYSSASYIL